MGIKVTIFGLLALICIASISFAGMILQGYDGAVAPSQRIWFSCICVDSFGAPCKADSIQGVIFEDTSRTDTVDFAPQNGIFGLDSSKWVYRYQASANPKEAACVYVKGWSPAWRSGTSAGLITFEIKDRDDFIDDIYARTDSTWEYMRDSSNTLAEFQAAIVNTMLANANPFKADAGELSDSLLNTYFLDDSVAEKVWAHSSATFVINSLQAIIDSLQHPSRYMADVSNVTVGTNNDKTGYALTTAERQAIADSVDNAVADEGWGYPFKLGE